MIDRTLTIFAPAKINLYLHIIARRDDGYHELDSLAAFADIGDRITIEPASDFSIAIEGPFANAFTAREKDYSPNSSNLVARAAWELSLLVRRDPKFRIRLQKNLPLASGLGGGSADAAATLWGLLELWDIPSSAPWLPELMRKLGADVPACLRSAPVRMRGIGDVLDPAPDMAEIPVVLINPAAHCPTREVFRRFVPPEQTSVDLTFESDSPNALIAFLKTTRNDLTPFALEIVPEIDEVISSLSACRDCCLARMSGSGASVFGLFDTIETAEDAAEKLSFAHPKWWVRYGMINRAVRY